MKRVLAIFILFGSFLFGVTTSHAALYFPHVATLNPWQTEICVINSSSTDTVRGNLESYGTTGNLVDSRQVSVGPNARTQIDVGTVIGNAGDNGYIVLQNTSGSPVGYTKFTLSGGDRVAIPAVGTVNTGNLYVSHIAWAPWWTGIALVNTTTASKTLTIRFNTGDVRTIELGAKKHYANTIAALFGNIDSRIVSAVIENADGIVGLELFGPLPGLGNQLGGVPLSSKTASTLYYPHVANDTEWWTGTVAYNPSATTATVTVKPYGVSGNLLGSFPRNLASGAKLIWPDDFSMPPDTAWFSLQSQYPLTGFELFGTRDFRRLAGYSVVGIEGQEGIFPKVEKNGGWTGIAFVNTEDQQATVNLKAFTDLGGNPISTSTKTLMAHEKWVGDPASLLSNLNAATYISFSANRKVAGFQLNNNNPAMNTMLDALPSLSASSPGDDAMAIINKALDLFKYQSTVTLGMQTVTDIMGQILNSDAGGTCPLVTVNPPLTESTLPSAITITANYGNGCRATDGSTIAGQVVLAITSIVMTDTNLSLDYALTATNLTRNGVLVLNGSVSGHIAYTGSQANVSVHFNNFQVADSSMSGNLTMTVPNLDLSADTLDITNMTLSFDNLTAAGYTVSSGTLTLTSTGTNASQMVANLNTDQGAVSLTLTVQTPSDTRTIISTPTPGTIAGYTVTLTNVTMDTGVCNGYPSSGSITASKGGSSATKVFTPSCPAPQMRVQVSPAQDRNPWFYFSKDLYKYLTGKR